jgi:hypothetical protein
MWRNLYGITPTCCKDSVGRISRRELQNQQVAEARGTVHHRGQPSRTRNLLISRQARSAPAVRLSNPGLFSGVCLPARAAGSGSARAPPVPCPSRCKPCTQSRWRASIGFMFMRVADGCWGSTRAWRAGLTAVSHQRDPAHPPSQGPRNQLTHARKGEAVRHRGGYACGDREPMPACMPVAPWRASISGGLVMLAERR